ncbi:UNVERIFIED_CONTAM: hypothetical protein BEN50_03905 [Euhalothece sp. KZN 001]
MKEKNITRVSWEEWGKMKGNTDWERLRNMTEEEIERNALDDPDALPYTEEELEQFEPVPFPPPEEWLRSKSVKALEHQDDPSD